MGVRSTTWGTASVFSLLRCTVSFTTFHFSGWCKYHQKKRNHRENGLSDTLKMGGWSVYQTKAKHPPTFSVIRLIQVWSTLSHLRTVGWRNMYSKETHSKHATLTGVRKSHWPLNTEGGVPAPPRSRHVACTSLQGHHLLFWIMNGKSKDNVELITDQL